MGETLQKQVNKLLSDKLAHKRWVAMFLCLAILVGLGTTAMLRETGVAMTHTEKVLDCQLELPSGEGYADYVVHVHNDDCYDADGNLVCQLPEIPAHVHTEDCYTTERILICGQEEAGGHVHTDACYTRVRGELLCGQEESEGHQHTEACYTKVRGELICTDESEEHEHSDACYAWSNELSCGQEERQGHSHSDDCYAWSTELTCGQEEGAAGHVHSDDCYEIRRTLSCGQLELHTHDDSCYDADGKLICGQLQLVEHVHGEDCFKTVELTAEEVEKKAKEEKEKQEAKPEDESDPTADVETEADWTARFAGMTKTGHWDQDVVAVAKTQLGYAESTRNFEVTEQGTHKGYTRYGAWYGLPYGEWCAMFVSFCLHYAGVPEEAFPYDCGCTTWIDALSKRGMYAPVGEYQPKSGDVIFFDFDNDGRSDHVGLVSDVYDTDGSLVIETIEGNKVETVERFTYYNNTGILGYGILPENPNAPAKADKVEDEQTVFFTDDNTAEDTTVTDDETGSETVEEEALSYPAQSFDGLVGGIFVIVDADEGAFPEGTTMEVKAVDSAEIMDAVTDAVEKEVVRVQAVDITFRDADGNEIEPKIPVRVQMRAVGGTDGANQQVVVHVEDNGAASIVDAAREVGSRVDFDADSFSVYALVYTVDLHYEVNGKTYEFSLPGGGYITSRQLIEALGIIGDESQGVDLDQFVADIQRVEFSEPSLVWVGKLDSETTVGQVKADKGLECVYSADLTAEQVAEINAAAVSAGEWILISLQPFMSEETLSVTLQDGDVFTVKVTDAWVSRTVISASGETYTVTLQYGEEAGLPEDADLSVREILADTEEYEAYLNDSAATLKIASENVALARFFDIDIVDGGGEKVEPKAEVFVSITLDDMPESAVQAESHVVHFKESDTDILTAAEAVDAETGAKLLRFAADSFSVYGVITTNTVEDLDGYSVKMDIYGSYLLAENVDNESPAKIAKGSATDAAVWTFKKQGDAYNIYTIDAENGSQKYINIGTPAGRSAPASVSDQPQALYVQKNTDGTYGIYRNVNGTSYYLNQFEGTSGRGYAAWADGNDGNSKLSFTFTEAVLSTYDHYMVLVKQSVGDNQYKYYIVLNDGTLEEVQYNDTDNSVTADDPMLWIYTGSNIYHHSTQVAYDGNRLPTDFFNRYIDPSSETGWSEDPSDAERDPNDTNKLKEPRTQSAVAALVYENNKLKSANGNYYIGVDDASGTLRIKGKVSQADAAEILFADAVNVPSVSWTNHTVNHIDISIQGSASADVPLAYGKYYDANHNVVMDVSSFTKLKLTEAQVVDPEQLEIKVEDMKRSTIRATVSGENGPEDLPDAFYLSGYSSNDVFGSSTKQVRIEGSFKVANLKGTEYESVDPYRYNHDDTYKNAVNEARKANKITYSVTVVKPISFYLQKLIVDNNGDPVLDDEGNEQYIQLYDAGGNALKVSADVAFSASFDFWDLRNECPPLQKGNVYWDDGYNKWQAGEIWQTGDQTIGGCGMDFKLGADSESNVTVYAIEITKLVVDENGNRIKSDDAGSNTFYIYKNGSGTGTYEANGERTSYVLPEYDDVKDLNIGSYTQPIDYTGYTLQHEKTISVGSDGLGLVYDYDAQPARYYIKEDPDSIVDQITDVSGQTWEYKNTYILTEYAWRNHENDNYVHVSDTYTKNLSGEYSANEYGSVPEILGLHYGYNGTDGPYTNDFLEFFVYNVYQAPRVDVPVIKTWDDFAAGQYDWQTTFKLQWAPLYEGDKTPLVAFQDVTPLKTLTINKADMNGVTQDLINRYLAGDNTLTAEEISKVEAITFMDLPKYGTDTNGNTFRYQYSLEETSYRVTNSATGVILYSWSENDGYNDPDESTHYQPYYPHDAGETVGNNEEQNAANTNYYIDVRNASKNISQKEYINVSLDKQWDSSFADRDDSYWAEFELKRFVHTEYRDVSQMSDADRAAEKVTITLKANGEVIDTIQVLPNVGLYLAGNFKPHDAEKTATFETDPSVRLANGSRVTSLTATAAGSNQSNALVRTQEFFVTQNTEITLTDGKDNLVEGNLAEILDTAAGTSPVKDRSFSQTIRLDSSNGWHVDLDDLLRMTTSSGDDDDNENVTYYEYYFEEVDSNPKGYAQYFRAENGTATNVLSGDSDHQIETNDSIIALNGPANRLIVKKYWRGVPDTTGFPAVKFTLYQAWADGNEGWVYESQDGTRYEHIELSGNSLEWICPEVLPSTRIDTSQYGNPSRAVKYYVQEEVRNGETKEGGITTSWQFYYYLTSDGKQTNAGHQGYFAGMTGSDLASKGGIITICNKLNSYMQLDIQKQFFELKDAGSWDNVTAHSDMKKNAVLGFKVIRAIKTADGKWLDERGNDSDDPVWMDYSDEMLCGYDENGNAVVRQSANDIFWLHDAGGDWHFRIEDNQGDANNVNAGGSGLPCYGFYIRNGEDIPVEYWYSFRETNVYKNLNKDPYPEWDWYSSITPVNAYGPKTMEAFPKAFSGQDEKRIANFQASDLIIDKQWIGDVSAQSVYIKIWRVAGDNGTPEDFTAVIAKDVRDNNNWQMYVTDPSVVDTYRNCLILSGDSEDDEWTFSMKVNRALLASVSGTSNSAKEYHYYIQEVGYRTLDGEYRTNVNGKFKPLYNKWVGTATGGNWQSAPVNFDSYAGNNIKIGAKGENKLRVINRSEPSTSYTVQKAFYGAQGSTGLSSTISGYPTDGSKQVVVELQQRYRYEKDGQVSADGETWIPETDPEAENTWTVGWQSAESAVPQTITLPLPKPEGSVLSDAAWYGSPAAWSYTWEGLDLEKVLADDANPENRKVAQLYYRAVETSTPGWYNTLIGDENGQKAVQDATEQSSITNERNTCTLYLNKEWTGLGEGKEWPARYVVYYQLIQNFHLTSVDDSGAEPVYSYDETPVKSVDMVTAYSDGYTSDSVHTQATGTLEEDNHKLTLTKLPLFGYFTATAADVEAAAEKGITLTAGTVYPVYYTYSVRETGVKNGNREDVDFTPQTVEFSEKTGTQTGTQTGEQQGETTTTDSKEYEATLTNAIISVDVTKTWTGTPNADSVQVKLYRTTEIPADELCKTTINVSFGSNFEQITDSTITATVGGKTVTLTKSGDSDLWTGTVNLEKGKTQTIHFTAPNVSEGYTVTLNDQEITVPDAATQTVNVSGSVAASSTGRNITVNITNSAGGGSDWGIWGPQIFYDGAWREMGNGSAFHVDDQQAHEVQFGVWANGQFPDGIVLTLGDQTWNARSGSSTIHYTVPAGSNDVTVPATATRSGGGSQESTRTITVNVTWADGSHNASYNNLFYSGWGGTGIGSTTTTNGNTQTFVWNGVPTTGSNLFVQLGYSGYDLQNGYSVNVTGSDFSYNNNNSELLLGDITPGTSDVTINVTLEKKESPGTTKAVVHVDNTIGTLEGPWVNLSNLNVGQRYALSMNIKNTPQDQVQFVVTGADSDYESTNRWDSNGGAWTLYITPTAAGTPVDIYISAPASTNAVGQMAAARMSRLRLGGDIPALTAAAAEASSTTVSLGHADSGGTGGTGADTPEIIGNQDYPTFTEADLVDTQTLNAGNKWQYQWTNLAPADPDGNKYYYYVVEEVPDGTQKVTYTRKEADGNTTVDITNKPVTNPQYGTLRVTKSVVASDGQELNRVFTIRLKQGDKYLQWTASDNYQWVTSQSDATTWTFNNGGSVTFTGLDLNQTYTVVEETGTGYVEIEGYQFLGAESTTSYSVEVASATATYEGTITNRYQLNDIDLQILKVDDKDMTTPLEGAQFTLRKLDPAGSGSYLTGDAEVTKTSSGTGGGDLTTTDGKATISGVKDGYYEISETKLPAGYVLTDSGKFYIKVVNGELTRLIPGDGPVTNWQPDTSTTGKIRYNADDGFIVGNKAGVELPTTGGKGTNLYTALGAALCLGSALVYGAGTVLGRRRKEGDGPA